MQHARCTLRSYSMSCRVARYQCVCILLLDTRSCSVHGDTGGHGLAWCRTKFEGVFDGCFGAAAYARFVACLVQERAHAPSHTVAVEVSDMRGAGLSI